MLWHLGSYWSWRNYPSQSYLISRDSNNLPANTPLIYKSIDPKPVLWTPSDSYTPGGNIPLPWLSYSPEPAEILQTIQS